MEVVPTSDSPDIDEGGEAPCLAAHLAGPVEVTDGFLAGAVRTLADAVIVADRDETIVFWNDAATRLFGWSAAEAVGRTLDLIVPERFRDRHRTGYRQTMASGETRYADEVLEVPALHRDGRRLSIAFTVTLVRPPGMREPTAVVAVLRDDTARWEERRRRRAEAPPSP